LARKLGSVEYGILLTTMGIANTAAATVGGSLNNTRLLLNSNYEDNGYRGDFLLVLSSTMIFMLIVFDFSIIRVETKFLTILFLSLYVVLNAIRSYGVVVFVMKLDYFKNLICNCFIAVGYIIGLFLMNYFNPEIMWPLCFCIGEVLAIIYLLMASSIFKEPLAITPFFSKTIRKNFALMLATLIAGALVYLDRMIILPVLGGASATTYTIASVFGKSIGMLMAPISGVILSYFAQKGFAMTEKKYKDFAIINVFIALGFWIVSLLVGYWFTKILYPNEVEEARKYMTIANASSIISIFGNMMQTTVLRYASSYWIVVIQSVQGSLYLLLGIIAASNYGLLGFSYATLGVAILRAILITIIGNKYVKKVEVNT
jgi:O-antigen/teichoic acid export membrane protein